MAKRDKESAEPKTEAPEVPAGIERNYWLGVYRVFRYSGVTVAGVPFQQATQLTVESGNVEGNYKLGDRRLGHVLRLSEDKVREIREKVAKMVVVWPGKIGGKGECLIRKTTLKGYRSRPDHEEPLGKYLYMVPVDDPDGFNRTKEPAPLSATA